MHDLAKALILLGAALVGAGLLLLISPRVPFLGKLPGDIVVKRGNLTLSFPLASSIVVSLIISALLYFIGKLR